MKKLIVRCGNGMIFEVDRKRLEAITCSTYDAYCFSDPDDSVDYVSYDEWLEIRNEMYDSEQGEQCIAKHFGYAIETVSVSATPRALKSEYSLETTRDLKAVNLETFNNLQEFFGGDK